MEDLLRTLVSALVEHPEAVRIDRIERDDCLLLELRVDPEDMGRVIGKSGRRAQAIRTIMKAKANQCGERVLIDICD